jgi:opacity protein-like surface antigen
MHPRRAAFLIAVLALAAAAPASAAPARSGGPSRWALLVGVEDGDFDAGLQLRADLDFVQRPLSPGVAFSIVGSVGYSYFDDGFTEFPSGRSVDQTLSLLKLVPAARFKFGRGPIQPYADAGLGLYYGSYHWHYREPSTGFASSAHDSSVGITMRLAGGVNFEVSPALALGVELGFQPYFGDVPDDTYTSLLASATFRL